MAMMFRVGTSALYLLCLAALVSPSPARRFQVQHDGDHFNVTIDNVLVIQHTPESPFLFVGTGSISFQELHGNFKVDQYITQKIPLPHVTVDEITDETGPVVVHLTSGDNVKASLTFRSTESHALEVVFDQLPPGFDRFWVRLWAESDEAVYGGGEQFTYFNMRGHDFPIWTREQGVGRDKRLPSTYAADVTGAAGGDYHTSYSPQPTFVTSRRYYCHLSSYNYCHLDFRAPDFHELFIVDRPGSLQLGAATSLEGIVQHLTSVFGRQPALPEWLHDGVTLGVQGGTAKMLGYLEQARENGVHVTGLWIQDWSGEIFTSFGKRVYWNWQWDPKMYPDLDDVIKQLRMEGVRILVYMNMHLHTGGALFKQADTAGHLVKNASGQSFIQDFGEFDCGTVDLTSPAAFKWYKGVIRRNLIDLGLGGWMADFGEYTPVDGVFASGEPGRLVHNRYPVLWAQLCREAVEEAGKLGEIVFFTRAGAAGLSRHSLLGWAGDQNVDWSLSDGIPTTTAAALSWCMSGMGITHYDIGGYTTVSQTAAGSNWHGNLTQVRTLEMLMRSAETAVFTPVMRTHEGNKPPLNAQVYSTNETFAAFGHLVELFRTLKPYRKSVEADYITSGTPMMRPLVLHYENEAAAQNEQFEYMFGRDILVAPIIEEGATTRSVFLPTDEWTHIFSGASYSGPATIEISAPMGQPPVFYRSVSPFADLFKSLRRAGECHKDTECP